MRINWRNSEWMNKIEINNFNRYDDIESGENV